VKRWEESLPWERASPTLLEGHQVPGAGKLCGRMDQDPNATSPGGVGILDDVFQWVADEEWSQSRTHLHLPSSCA
jgi:hypothetical protein